MTRAGLAVVALSLTLGVALSSAVSPAYPMITPTLRDLVADSELVVWARVESNTLLPGDPDAPNVPRDQLATLLVDTAYKGAVAPGDRVEVTHGFWFLCDMPPSYPTGEHVLAFLRPGWGDASDAWFTTTSTHYGTRQPNAEALAVWGARVRELVAIEGLATLREQRAATCEWITRLIEEPSTLHQAYLELSRDPDEDRYHASPRFRLEWLGPRQLERVRAVIAQGDTQTRKLRWIQRYVDALPEERRGR